MRKILLLGLVVLLLACTPVDDHDSVDHSHDGDDDHDLPPAPDVPGNDVGLTPAVCNAAGGNWNECGSPCAGTNSDFCIESCEAMCECGGIAGFSCPDGYTCLLSGEIADEMGKCIEGHGRE